MSRDRPGLSGVKGEGGKRDRALERVAETGQKYIPAYNVLSSLRSLSFSREFWNA
jgi:hypothetical protein